MTDLKLVPTNKIDLRNLDEFGARPENNNVHDRLMLKGLGALVTEMLEDRFADDPPCITFPIAWDFGDPRGDGGGGPPVADPVTLYVHLPLGATEDSVDYACSLEDVIDYLIDGAANPQTGKVDGEHKDICIRVAARLRELADKLDTSLAAETP